MSGQKKPPECKMCDRRPMVPIPRLDGTDSSFLGCPNCDNPKGVMPQLTDPA